MTLATFATNLALMIFVTVVGLLGLIDMEWLGNTFKLAGAIHVLFAIKLDLPVEILFGAFLGCGILGLIGTFVLKKNKRSGYYVQVAFTCASADYGDLEHSVFFGY